MNGEKKDDRSSPEANAQEQMAAQRATGGELTAPPVVETSKNEDDDWGEDFSEEAVKKRMEELSDAAKQMAFTDDLEKTQEERLNKLYLYFPFIVVFYFILPYNGTVSLAT